MSTITKEFTKERLEEIAEDGFLKHGESKALARIALASLEARPVALRDERSGSGGISKKPGFNDLPHGTPIYAAPSALSATIKDEPVAWLWSHRKYPSEVTLVRPEDDEKAEAAQWSGWSYKALYSEPVTTANKLRDAVEIIRNSGKEIDAEKILAERDALNAPDCWCRTCRPVTISDMRFVVCPECGSKRCPHANDHRHACTGSNEPGQEGSAYPAAPQQEAKP
ncbi:hypothetical protein [Enterobacter mori]|uniref:Uncharacterized protein n=1 Tax=Enterobacter mori TaxID=539813 RepID=A0A9Q7NSF1_9ENTR|nr:hypothetical protein [Enterobacter mori]MCC8231863.1 hypothetical protein [Enterobacter mori]MCC8241234.1 hypothetical protein [Enterobacter mori]RTQ23458.1 hypothetical protein EKN29_14950 [Enterobacter mori]